MVIRSNTRSRCPIWRSVAARLLASCVCMLPKPVNSIDLPCRAQFLPSLPTRWVPPSRGRCSGARSVAVGKGMEVACGGGKAQALNVAMESGLLKPPVPSIKKRR